jgi:hypothetical protein
MDGSRKPTIFAASSFAIAEDVDSDSFAERAAGAKN